MKTYGIKDADGVEFAFEVENLLLGRHGLSRLVAQIPGCLVIRRPGWFSGSSEDEFCEFELEGIRFVAWEPWGDNSRYWVGLKSTEGSSSGWCPQVDRVREAFDQARPFFGILFGPSPKAGAANGDPGQSFPDDGNGDVLRRMQASGDQLDAARDMEFAFVFETRSEAERFAGEVAAPGFQAKASPYPESGMWQVVVTHSMTPTHAAITELEARLTRMAVELGGKADGWGSFQQE